MVSERFRSQLILFRWFWHTKDMVSRVNMNHLTGHTAAKITAEVDRRSSDFILIDVAPKRIALLRVAKHLKPHLDQILVCSDWQTREDLLCSAYEVLFNFQKALGLVPKGATGQKQPFYGRPQQIFDTGTMVATLGESAPRSLARLKYPIGTVNQFIDDQNLLSDALQCRRADSFFRE